MCCLDFRKKKQKSFRQNCIFQTNWFISLELFWGCGIGCLVFVDEKESKSQSNARQILCQCFAGFHTTHLHDFNGKIWPTQGHWFRCNGTVDWMKSDEATTGSEGQSRWAPNIHIHPNNMIGFWGKASGGVSWCHEILFGWSIKTIILSASKVSCVCFCVWDFLWVASNCSSISIKFVSRHVFHNKHRDICTLSARISKWLGMGLCGSFQGFKATRLDHGELKVEHCKETIILHFEIQHCGNLIKMVVWTWGQSGPVCCVTGVTGITWCCAESRHRRVRVVQAGSGKQAFCSDALLLISSGLYRYLYIVCCFAGFGFLWKCARTDDLLWNQQTVCVWCNTTTKNIWPSPSAASSICWNWNLSLVRIYNFCFDSFFFRQPERNMCVFSDKRLKLIVFCTNGNPFYWSTSSYKCCESL